VSSMPAADDVVLRAERVTKRFRSGGGLLDRGRHVTAVADVSLAVRRSEILAVVGESGSGKSTLGRMLAGLLAPSDGQVLCEGEDIKGMDRARWMRFRRRVQVVFQDPYSSLDPRMPIAAQIREPLDIHKIGAPAERNRRVAELMDRVGLDPAYAKANPAELSGGQRQRVGIAIALASSPDIIVADEPTSALDVSVQAQVLNLLADLQRDQRLTLVFITHDLGLVRHFCDRAAVMYFGRVVEEAETATLFASPRHPYTRMLLSAIPDPDPSQRGEWSQPDGDPPSALSPPSGCAFHPRCPVAAELCAAETPLLERVGERHRAACFRAAGALQPDPTPKPADLINQGEDARSWP
jgi:oligopeptide/dipeptide ABC transporter ATP-binding protein